MEDKREELKEVERSKLERENLELRDDIDNILKMNSDNPDYFNLWDKINKLVSNEIIQQDEEDL